VGHYCHLCGRSRPNESFSGRGHRSHVCKECQRLPRADRKRSEELNELYGFIAQSNISEKTVRRLETLCQASDDLMRELADAILQVAHLYPRKRRRYVRMSREHPLLLNRLKQVLGDAWWDDLQFRGGLGEGLEAQIVRVRPSSGATGAARGIMPNPMAANRVSDSAAREIGSVSPGTFAPGKGLKRVIVHTDGACQKNPGPGGWAAILRYGKHVKELSGADAATTNNRMELQAALAALRALKEPCAVEIFTDSKYLRDAVSLWLPRWKTNGWRTVERTPVKNQDLWQQLDQLCARHSVVWRWLKAHAGHRDNERCDKLARGEHLRRSHHSLV
jgi:ribonuclease HI